MRKVTKVAASKPRQSNNCLHHSRGVESGLIRLVLRCQLSQTLRIYSFPTNLWSNYVSTRHVRVGNYRVIQPERLLRHMSLWRGFWRQPTVWVIMGRVVFHFSVIVPVIEGNPVLYDANYMTDEICRHFVYLFITLSYQTDRKVFSIIGMKG